MKLEFSGFDWDDGNVHKCQKHGVSLEVIERVFLDDNKIIPDIEHSYSEDRLIAMANVDGRYAFIVFTMRGKLVRPVSARYMHKDEVEYYEEEANN